MKKEVNFESEILLHRIASLMLCGFFVWVFAILLDCRKLTNSWTFLLVEIFLLVGVKLIMERPAHKPIRTWCDVLNMKLASFPRTVGERRSIASWAMKQLEDAGGKSKAAFEERRKKNLAFVTLEVASFPDQTPAELLTKKRRLRKELSKAKRELKRATKLAKKENERYLRIWDLFTSAQILTDVGSDPARFRDSIRVAPEVSYMRIPL